MIVEAGILFVIEVVEQADHTPQLSAGLSQDEISAHKARMQASTASACLRKLSDWVNSISKPMLLSIIHGFLPCFSRVFSQLVLLLP